MSPPIAKKPARTASAVVRSLFDVIDRSDLSYGAVGAAAGVHHVTLSKWKHGVAAPRWVDFENVVQSLGYEIALRPRENEA